MDQQIDYLIASACEVFTADGDREATAMVARIREAAERNVDPTLSADDRAEQVFANMDISYRVHLAIGSRCVSAETVTQIVRSMV